MRTEKGKRVSVTVDAHTYKEVKKLAKREVCTISGFCTYVMEQNSAYLLFILNLL